MAISFSKTSDASLSGVNSLVFGAAWDRKTVKLSGWKAKVAQATKGKVNLGGGEQDIDLDLALVLYQNGEPKRMAIGHNQHPVAGVEHSGDNQTGKGDGDDEAISLDLNKLPSSITEWAVVVSAFKQGTTFDNAQNVSLNVYDNSGRKPELLDELMPTLGLGENAVVVATGKKDASGSWTMRLVDKGGKLSIQGNDSSLLDFTKRTAGL